MVSPLASLKHNALYERLGGQGCLSLIAEQWCERVLADTELAPYVGPVDRPSWYQEQTEFLIYAVGGPLPAPPRSLPALCLQLPATRRHVDRLLRHLLAAMLWANVPWPAIEEALEAVASLIPAAHLAESAQPAAGR